MTIMVRFTKYAPILVGVLEPVWSGFIDSIHLFIHMMYLRYSVIFVSSLLQSLIYVLARTGPLA